MKKTNVMRLLDANKIEYKSYSYDITDDRIDGISVAEKIGKPVDMVYKTLVCQGEPRNYYVFIIPVDKELDLKAGAKAVDEKSISMVKVSDINKLTGYERGGCSPIGMRREYLTVISKEAEDKNEFIVSAGQIGSQVEISPKDIAEFVEIKFAEIT